MNTSTAGSKFPLEIDRVPQSIQVITEDAFQDQGAQSIGDIMKQMPSANVFGLRFGRFPSVTIRGFGTEQIRNGIQQLFFAGTDFSALSYIQNVEVLKGPGSVLFGQGGNGGGIINVVTKRPYDRLGAEVSFTRGGWTGFGGDITRGQWDINALLTPDGALKARFTGQVERSDTFINFQDLDRENFGLALTYDNGGPVRAFINAEYQHRETLPNPGLPAVGTVQGSDVGQVLRNTFLGEPKFDKLTVDAPLVQAWVEFDVLDNWNNIFKNWKVIPRYQYQQFNGSQDQVFLGATTVDPVNGDILVSRSGRTDFNEKDVIHIGQIDITGMIDTGPLTHQILLSGDYQNKRSPSDGNDNNKWFNRINVPAIDALNPAYLSSAPQINPNIVTFGQNYQVWAATFQDVVSITPYFDLMGGFRYTTASGGPRGNLVNRVRPGNNEVDNTSFQIGGTFHVTDSIHLFSGYGEGFNLNLAGQKADGSAFAPGEFDQVEAGIKADFPWGLRGTTSFFDITRSNVTTPDRQNPGFSVQTGEVRHRGAELELAYQVTPQWYFQGGYAFIDSDITQSNAGDEGNRFQNTPTHQGNVWTHYQFDRGLLRNLTLSSGVNFVGDRPLDNATTVELTNFTI
ncbi:ferrichrome iron receptor [Nitrosococcus oceani ATCC 19707]|uniref:Ferrichrome iron receptor n=2 Tax=Nitrosococcus oceani TaxID=1229 RepID=Q3JE97_NITOC|nr:TonB-dependent receptor [Nitrosococcus oceani]ABA56849.1 ferrichrome iron receptor [Nitrosococcus oceani ATCC 19707]EDZ65385.1 TonB-dependent receptor plug domain protein [Nitrosococcus oceani AFC27]KFI20802.1 ligand-gated channel [Nitrosococcus oceani C-27]GEM20605.1 ligand-gated channel [Nitrosococcus oceani]